MSETDMKPVILQVVWGDDFQRKMKMMKHGVLRICSLIREISYVSAEI